MICRNCGKEINDEALFCKFCGTKVEKESEVQIKEAEQKEVVIQKEISNEDTKNEQMEESKKEVSKLEKALNNLNNRQKKCPHCGMLLLNGAKFCKNCGHEV